jgi:hypothetical protein
MTSKISDFHALAKGTALEFAWVVKVCDGKCIPQGVTLFNPKQVVVKLGGGDI